MSSITIPATMDAGAWFETAKQAAAHLTRVAHVLHQLNRADQGCSLDTLFALQLQPSERLSQLNADLAVLAQVAAAHGNATPVLNFAGSATIAELLPPLAALLEAVAPLPYLAPTAQVLISDQTVQVFDRLSLFRLMQAESGESEAVDITALAQNAPESVLAVAVAHQLMPIASYTINP